MRPRPSSLPNIDVVVHNFSQLSSSHAASHSISHQRSNIDIKIKQRFRQHTPATPSTRTPQSPTQAMVCGLDLLRGARALRLPNTPTPFAIPSPASSSRVTLQAQPQQSSRFHSSARTLRAPVPHSPLVPRPQTGYPATASKASGGNSGKRPNAYTVWYREIFPCEFGESVAVVQVRES